MQHLGTVLATPRFPEPFHIRTRGHKEAVLIERRSDALALTAALWEIRRKEQEHERAQTLALEQANNEIERLRKALVAAQASVNREGPAFEQHHKPAQIASLWAKDPKTIRHMFENEPDVLIDDKPETRNKRGYRSFSIPDSAVERVHRRLSSR